MFLCCCIGDFSLKFAYYFPVSSNYVPISSFLLFCDAFFCFGLSQFLDYDYSLKDKHERKTFFNAVLNFFARSLLEGVKIEYQVTSAVSFFANDVIL